MDRVFMLVIFDEMLKEIKKTEESLIVLNKFKQVIKFESNKKFI